MNYRSSFITNSIKSLSFTKYPLVFIIAIASFQVLAAPSNFGTFTRDLSPEAGSIASGRYTTPTGATGRYTVSAGASNGYSGRSFTVGNNGIEIRNDANTDIANDKFTYTFAITPTNNTAIHTIKIGQASYAADGNSEVARHTLAFTKNSQINTPAEATVKNNSAVPLYYEAMGDYFMGRRESPTSNTFRYDVDTPEPQLRSNSDNKLYFYRLDFLNGTNLGSNRFRPSTTNNEVRIRNNASGFLPSSATFTNILKSTSTSPNNQSTFSPLAVGTSTSNNKNIQYVSYGMANTDSSYVVALRNASSVTLTYEGIMNGSNAFEGEKVGETFNEWISFGVESEPLNYIFSGTVYNDNGGIDDQFATKNPDTIGGIYNNNQYFNGVFDRNESGIASSKVSLANNCNRSKPTIIATQTITPADAGAYNFTIPISTINTSNSICVIEEDNNNYPIRTTSAIQIISFIPNQYLYENINFGRVIEANKALVLEKEQAANDCSITSLTDPSLTYSKNPLNSSETGVSVSPGMCIAYKITATNRANRNITSFVMQDKLQKLGEKGATVTSKLVEPRFNAIDYAGDSAAIGDNGTVKTKSLALSARTSRIFYFNTQYGSTQALTGSSP
ncbi:hypothetical protein [Psychrobacter jeotgali]|uniref:hypothetical protein n=1 Tax=Psychrobacter jeotgali TaxID=179010 RepID=UPI00191831FE|nr:hypothetical protein [Psychrobacter jeotgali]